MSPEYRINRTMRVPQLRQKNTGNYFIRYGGKDHSLGSDKAKAQEKYLEHLEVWKELRQSKADARQLRSTDKKQIVLELAEQFIEAKFRERGSQASDYYTKHLKRFLVLYSKFYADSIGPKHLNALKIGMLGQGFAPKTINNDLVAIRTMFNWGSGLELCAPNNLKGCKNLPLGPAPDNSVGLDQVKSAFGMCDDKLKPWFALNYLCCCRPSEVVRLVNNEGEFAEDGIFVLDRGKMDARASMKRHIIMSDTALEWLDKAKPHWSRLDSYSAAFNKRCPFGPKVLEKSAASHLVRLHEARPEDVELLLGHVPSRLSVTYYQPAWPRLRKLAAQLSL